ncbi:MAG: tetratricopeptide repeat protein [Planctomycetota bacterium]
MRWILATTLLVLLATTSGVAQDPPDQPAAPDPPAPAAPDQPVPAAPPDTLPPLTEEQLEDLCNQLGASDPDLREDAWRQLVDAGDPALPWLQKSAKRLNMEMRWRARKALELVKWGVTTRLPGVADGLQAFLAMPDSRVRMRQIELWMQTYGNELLPFLRKICLKDPDRDVRERVFTLIASLGASTDILTDLAEQCVEQDSAATWAWRALARIYHDSGRDDDAIRWLRRVLDQSPNDYASHAMLARIYTERGDLQNAVLAHKAARDMAGAGPPRTAHVQALANLYLQLGDRKSAGEALQALMQEDKNNPEPALMLINFWFEADETAKAAELADRCLAEWPGNRALGDHVDRLVRLLIDAWWNRGEYNRLEDLVRRQRDDAAARGMGGDSVWMLLMHMWACVRAGHANVAGDLLIEYADANKDDTDELAALLAICRHFALPDKVNAHLHELGAALPEHIFELREAMLELQAGNRERATTLFRTAMTAMAPRPGRDLRFDQLAELLPVCDAIGDAESTKVLIDQLARNSSFSPASAASFSGRLTRAATVVAVYRAAWSGRTNRDDDYDAAFNYAQELARYGFVDEGITVLKRLVDKESPDSWRMRYLQDSLASCYSAAGKIDEARQIRERQLETNRNTSTLQALITLELMAGRLTRARELAEQGVDTMPSDTTRQGLLEHLIRDRDYDRVLRELADHPPADNNARRRGLIMDARARLATRDFPGAMNSLRRLLAAFGESGVVRTEELEASMMLCMLGQHDRAHVRLNWLEPDKDRPAPDMRGRDSRSTNTAHNLFLQLAADAFAREAGGDLTGALAVWLRAWRCAMLDYQAGMVRTRLAELATPERLKAVREAMEPELVRVFGESVKDGKPAGVRHTWRNRLLVYAHLRALLGDDAVAQRLIGGMVEHGLTNDLEFMHVIAPPDPIEMRGYFTQLTPDMALELMELLLRPEALPGMPGDYTPPAGDAATARAVQAFDLGVRVLERFPNELHVGALLLEAASRCGRNDHPVAVAMRQRFALNSPLDLIPTYVAAFHFQMTGWNELAIPAWKRLLDTPSKETHVISNGEEYLGRLLWQIPAMRDQACALWAKMNSRVAFNGWYIDEDGYEPHSYLSRQARYRASVLLAAGDTAAAIEALKLACWYSPYEPECALKLGQLLAADGKLDDARTLLRPWNVTLTLLARTWPSWAAPGAALAALQAIPGLALQPVPDAHQPVGPEDGDEQHNDGDGGRKQD